VPVNWCVFAEWIVRDRIRHLHREEVKKSVGFRVSEGERREHSGDRSILWISLEPFLGGHG